jgi:regulator of sigma E protease
MNGVRVDLFSLGFGPVLLSFRRGYGLQTGSSVKRYDEALRKLRDLLPAEREALAQGNPRALLPPGQTEYRLALIPLGGFVKMAGEPLGEERTGAPDELTSKKPWQRFLIFVAGTVMNFLVAFPLCILAFAVGRTLSEPRLSTVPAPDSAEWEAGMTAGDRIVSVNGVEINHLEAYKKEILRAPDGIPLTVEIERGDPPQRIALRLLPRGADRISATPPSHVVDSVKSGSPGDKAGLQPDDVIRELGGRRILDLSEILTAVKPSAGKPLPVKVFRPSTGETLDLTLTPGTNPNADGRHVYDAGDLRFEPVIRKLHALSCARDFLQEGDRLLELDETAVATDRDVRELIATRGGKTVTVKFLRAGEEKVNHCTLRTNALGRGTLDVVLGVIGGLPALGDVPDGSELAKAGAKKGDRILSVDGWENLSLADIQRNIEESLSKSVRVAIARADGTKVETELPVSAGPDGKKRAPLPLLEAYPRLLEVPVRWPLHAAGLRSGDRLLRLDIDGDGTLDLCTGVADLDKAAARDAFPVEVERDGKTLAFTVKPGPIPHGEIQVGFRFQTVFHRYPKRQAIVLGAREVLDISHLTFQILAKIVRGQEKASGMAGPIGIIHASYKVLQQGIGNFLWLLGLIAVSLAIFNLLPIPILDGGHILFLLVEKIKGSPVSEKTLYRAQLVGLVLLLGLLVFVTQNDIVRTLKEF